MATFDTIWTYSVVYEPPGTVATLAGLGTGISIIASSPDDIFQPGETIDVTIDGTPATVTFLAHTDDGTGWIGDTSFGTILFTNDTGLSGTVPVSATDFPVCYAAGTRILTTTGETFVEDLKIGDLVVTRFNGIQPIRWIGRQVMTRVSSGQIGTAFRSTSIPARWASGYRPGICSFPPGIRCWWTGSSFWPGLWLTA